jgi:hypothetical protein
MLEVEVEVELELELELELKRFSLSFSRPTINVRELWLIIIIVDTICII